jgi:hypothetical protein
MGGLEKSLASTNVPPVSRVDGVPDIGARHVLIFAVSLAACLSD